ncbi:MAG: Gfo/Idh/MocA family oxidoreductase [Rubripirellula sp.]
MTTSSTRFGVIGTGRITRRLVADLQSTDGAVVTAIASRSSERARWYGDQYGIDTAVEGYAELLKRDDVDAVYISLPPSMHAEWAIAAANHGKHVLCEKPLTVCVAQTQEIDQACQAAGVRWLDATGWLHHDRTDAFATWLGEGRFGKIGHVSAAVSFYQPFQSGDHRLDASLGGGCILDLGWYAGGLVRFAMGKMPTWVLADEVILSGVSQRLTAMMGFDDGATATISCGYDTATRKWFEVAGSESSLICDDFTRPWADRPARYWIHDAAGTVKSESFEGHQERNMIKRLIGGDSLSRYQQQAIDTQAIVEAVQESIKAGGTKFMLATMTV